MAKRKGQKDNQRCTRHYNEN